MLGRYTATEPHPSPGWDVYTWRLKGLEEGRQNGAENRAMAKASRGGAVIR